MTPWTNRAIFSENIDLVLFDCVLMLAFSQLVIPGSFCHRRPEVGCLCLDIGNQVTVYVSRKLGRAVDVPAAAGLLNVGLIVAKDWHQGRTSLRSALDFTLNNIHTYTFVMILNELSQSDSEDNPDQNKQLFQK